MEQSNEKDSTPEEKQPTQERPLSRRETLQLTSASGTAFLLSSQAAQLVEANEVSGEDGCIKRLSQSNGFINKRFNFDRTFDCAFEDEASEEGIPDDDDKSFAVEVWPNVEVAGCETTEEQLIWIGLVWGIDLDTRYKGGHYPEADLFQVKVDDIKLDFSINSDSPDNPTIVDTKYKDKDPDFPNQDGVSANYAPQLTTGLNFVVEALSAISTLGFYVQGSGNISNPVDESYNSVTAEYAPMGDVPIQQMADTVSGEELPLWCSPHPGYGLVIDTTDNNVVGATGGLGVHVNLSPGGELRSGKYLFEYNFTGTPKVSYGYGGVTELEPISLSDSFTIEVPEDDDDDDGGCWGNAC